ncbi:MAG: septum formation initiator family protein, partial [Actinomycetota bacterium]|nr:septum formation initiator family protein [Actinomycetota bacterium]
LTVVFAVLVVSYASSMRAYLQQKNHISDLRSQIATSTKQISALQREKARWGDNQYVASQARARFGWVMPGEIAFQVIGKDGKPLSAGDRLSDPNQIVHVAPTPWWSKEYDSLQRADHPPPTPKPPANRITPGAK